MSSDSNSALTDKPWVIIVGAGPSGLLLALLLAKAGIRVDVIDMGEKLDEQPRATHYGPPAVAQLRRAGVLQDVIAKGFFPDGVCWRKLDGTYLAGIDARDTEGDPDRLVCLPLNQLGTIIYQHLLSQPTARVHWSHRVTGIGQTPEEAWVDVTTGSGTQRLSAPYIVGCDGANSQIRRSLFGDWEFPGRTWDEQIVATNTYYDFHKHGFDWDANFIIDPNRWYMAARISKDGLWRVTDGEVGNLSRDEYLKRQPDKFRQMLPGHPEPSDYRIVNFSPYKVHQRLAKSMRVGRFLLAADAAHLCNPFGGLGLTGGIVDIGGLFDCLDGLHKGIADESILDKYSEWRRAKYQEIVDPISSENIRRLFGQDPDKALECDEFLKLCQRASKDKEFSKELQSSIHSITHDFTQYYTKTA